MTTYNTIMLSSILPGPVIYEKVASEAFLPGYLVELDSDDKLLKQDDAATVAPLLFVLEDDLRGRGIDDGYSAGDKSRAWQPLPGDQVYAFLADGQNVAKNELLESNADGTLRAYDTGQVIAMADEALSPSGDARILVTIV